MLDQCGRIFSGGNPISFSGLVGVHQRLGQLRQGGRTEADLIASMKWFEPRNPDQAGGIGQIPGPGNTGSPLPCRQRARARALLACCESGHSSHLSISSVRGLAVACRPSDVRISSNSDSLLAPGIPLTLRSDCTLEAVTKPFANRFRSGNGCVGQLGKLSGVERTDFFNREIRVRIGQSGAVINELPFDQVDFHDASPPSSSSVAGVSGGTCWANSEGASGSRGMGTAAGVAEVAG